MDDNLKFFTEFVERHRGELVLDCFDVVMLEDFKDVPDDDYYYVVSGKKGTYWTSCVGDLYPLKDVLPEDQYSRMLYIFNLNIDWWKSISIEANKKAKLDSQMAEWEKKWFGKSWYE